MQVICVKDAALYMLIDKVVSYVQGSTLSKLQQFSIFCDKIQAFETVLRQNRRFATECGCFNNLKQI